MKKLTSLSFLITIALLLNNTAANAAATIVEARQNSIKNARDNHFNIFKINNIFDKNTKIDRNGFFKWQNEIHTTITLIESKASSFPSSASLSKAVKLAKFIDGRIATIVLDKDKKQISDLEANLTELDQIIRTVNETKFYLNDKKLAKDVFLLVLAPELSSTMQYILNQAQKTTSKPIKNGN